MSEWREVKTHGAMLAFLAGKTVKSAEEYRPFRDAEEKSGRRLPGWGDEASLVVCTDGSAICCVIVDADPGYSEYTPGSDMFVYYYVTDKI